MKKMLLLFISAALCLTACVKPEDEKPSPAAQQTNIEEYLQRAHRANQLDAEREKPIPVEPLVDTSRLTHVTQVPDLDFLAQSFQRNRSSMQNRMQEAYTARMKTALAESAEQYKTQLQQVAQQATSPVDLAAKLTAAQAEQDKVIEQFIATQSAQTRLKPDQQLLERIAQRLSRRCDEYVEYMRLYYGDQTALKSRPIFEKAVQDYTYAMASAANEPELENKINEILAQTAQQIQQIASDTADPMGATPEDVITSLRSDMIQKHQTLENYIERLYGKEAVLESRKVFNQLLTEVGSTLRENMRLGQKKSSLQRFNQQYMGNMRLLQQQWNLQYGIAAIAALASADKADTTAVTAAQ